MSGKKAQPDVLALLVDNTPVLTVEITPEGSQIERVDVYVVDEAKLSSYVESLRKAIYAAQFLIWKSTGVLPRPVDMTIPLDQVDSDNENEIPF